MKGEKVDWSGAFDAVEDDGVKVEDKGGVSV